jgi:hypothetical protein
LIAVLIAVGFGVVVVNQTAQLVFLAGSIAPWLGEAVLWTLLTLYAFCLAVPLYLFVRLPKPLRAPATESDPSFAIYFDQLRSRLSANPHLLGQPLSTRPDVEAALGELNRVAETRTKDAASQVFVTTAISQNGSLDTFLVLAAQSKLVLEIARIYLQRPTVRELVYLYGNVAATAFVAGELEDLDLAEQVQPIIGAAFGSAAGAIPGFGPATTIFVNSVTTGAANAFLTLRVGIIAQQYCGVTVLAPRKAIRRSAVLRATQLLGSITLGGTKRVAAAIGSGSKAAIGDAFVTMGDQIKATALGIKGGAAAAVTRMKFWKSEDDPEPGHQ